MAESLFRFMTKELGISPTIVTINTLIDQYFKNNHPENAWLVFEQLKTLYTQIKPDNFTYTTLINGLKSNRDGMDLRRAFTLFEEYKLNS
jgi:pentatricopeptide repeat domain-containing protein 1